MKNKILKLFVLLTLTVFTICFLTCEKEGELPVKDTLEFDKETFYEQWAAWEELGIKDYSMKYKYEEYSSMTIFMFYCITVKDGVMIEKELLDGNDNLTDRDNPTVSAIFKDIYYVYNLNKNLRGSIKIIYDKDLHYPEIVYFDLTYKNPPTMWGKGAYYVSEFTPLTSEIE